MEKSGSVHEEAEIVSSSSAWNVHAAVQSGLTRIRRQLQLPNFVKVALQEYGGRFSYQTLSKWPYKNSEAASVTKLCQSGLTRIRRQLQLPNFVKVALQECSGSFSYQTFSKWPYKNAEAASVTKHCHLVLRIFIIK